MDNGKIQVIFHPKGRQDDEQTGINLLTIFNKSEKDSISDKELRDRLKH